MKKNSYLLSLEVESKTMSLMELTNIVGKEASEDSFNKNDIDGLGHRVQLSVWKSQYVDMEEDIDVSKAFKIWRESGLSAFLDDERECKDVSVCLNIGVFFKTACVTVELPYDHLAILAKRKISCVITSYPCSNDEGEKNDSNSPL